MKKRINYLLMIVLALSMLGICKAQTAENYTRDELLQLIAVEKQEIRLAAKELIVDTLPELIRTDPAAADQALAKASGMLNTMDQDDLMYLLGHLWARVGENTKAISTFNSLLRSHLNADARKMLNLVLYDQMISYLQKNDRKTAKEFLQAIVFENFNIDRYYPSYLYIWADLSAEDGEYEKVSSMLATYNQNRDTIMNVLLPQKKAVLDRVKNLDFNSFYQNPTQESYQSLMSQVEAIKVDLTAVYNQLISLRGIIYLDDVVKLHESELAMLDGLQANLTEYLSNTQNAQTIIQEGISKLEAVKLYVDNIARSNEVLDNILQREYEKVLNNEIDLAETKYSDMEMKRLLELEANIGYCDEIIAELDAAIADPQLAESRSRLQSMRAEWSERRTDYQIRKETNLQARKHSSDIEEAIFNDILMEYYANKQDSKNLNIQIAELEDFFKNDASQYLDTQNRDALQARVNTDVALVTNYNERDQVIRQNATGIEKNLEFIRLQLAYRNLRFKDQARLAQSGSLSEDEMIAQQTEILAEKRVLINQIQSFIDRNPDFKAIEQPDNTYLVTTADLYYNLAELQYSVEMNNPQQALESYRKVVQLGPNFVNRDAALYNIGFISSQQQRLQIDSHRSRFYEINTTALALDNASKYKYSDFAEAIESYQSIVDNYKESAYYDEALYRMGVLNYYLAIDADQPARYYSLATSQFDEIIAKPDSRLKYDALYQRGWLRLNSTNEQDLKLAMADFLSLLIAIENKQITNPVLVKDYRDDAVSNIAYCLIALDGLDFNSQAKGISELQNVFAGYSNQDVIRAVVDQAAAKKFNLDATMQATDYLWLKINMTPLALENPTYLDSILIVTERNAVQLREGQDISTVRQDIYLNLINNYDKNSEWYNVNKDKNIAPQLAIIRKAYEERSKRLKNEFINEPSTTNLATYQQHMNRFAAYTELFPEGLAAWNQATEKEEMILSTMLAENSQLPKDYLSAINNIKAFNDKYPEDEDYFQHEGLSYTFAMKVYDILKDRYAEPGFNPGADLPATEDDLFTWLYTNAQRFIGVLTSEKFRTPEREQQAVGILLTLGDAQYDRQRYSQATELYLKALEQQALISDVSKFDIYGKLALMAEQNKDYKKSEEYYRSALQFAQTPAQRDAITTNIHLQIQNNYTAAETGATGQTPDFNLAATERLRLAEQLPSTDVSKIQGLKWAAHQAYVKAGEYQKAIDLVLELAGDKTDVEEVYAYYYRASEIASADSLMGNKELGRSIRQSFIDKYPGSNRAYNLRLADIREMEKDAAKQEAAADAYLAIHQEARAKKLDIGTDPESALMINAAINYNKAGKKDKEVEVYKNFIEIYPQHQNVIPYMEYIADDYLAKGDTLRFEQLAKEIYVKDKTKSDRYKYMADYKLHKLWYGFDTAYKNGDYATAFKYRDDYKKLEASYIKEGLTFDSEGIYKYFAEVQKEYDDLQKRTAFFRTYDNQLTAIEKGNLMTASPAQLITVNANTKWENHLVGGTARRIPTFKNAVKAEVAKINKLLEQANDSGYDLDNSRRLRVYDLIARIYEKGASTIATQVAYFIRNATDAAAYRQQYSADELVNLINQVTSSQNSDLLTMAASTHMNIYNRYAMAGYKDQYTERSKSQLSAMNLLPDYKIEEYPLNNSWTLKLGDAPANLNPAMITSPLGVKLGSVTVPSNNDLSLTRTVPVKIAPDFALLHLVYPYDLDLKLNGNTLEASAVPTDTLVTGKPVTTRYAYWIPGTAWGEGQNILEFSAPNKSPELQTLSLNLQVFTDKRRIAASLPDETVMLYSDNSWKVVQTNPETGAETTAPAVYATNFGVNPDQIDGFPYASARAIWVSEEAPVDSVTFETSFVLDSDFREGKLEFVAPESAIILINGVAMEGTYAFDYDSDPFMVYPLTVPLNKDSIIQGKNTIRFVVNNNTPYRGFLAAITIIKAGKEDLR